MNKKLQHYGNASITKGIIGILSNPFNRALIHDALSPDQRGHLSTIWEALLHNCTARPRPPPAQYDRLGQFLFLTFHFPALEGMASRLNDSTIKKYRDAIRDLIKNDGIGGSDDYVGGFHYYYHSQTRDSQYPMQHFHAVVSRIRFACSDKVMLELFNGMPPEAQPEFSQYFFTDAILTDPEDFAAGMEKPWRRLLREISRLHNIPEQPSLVHAEDGTGQDIRDRKDASHYIKNNGLHTFRRMRVLPDGAGHVLLEHFDKDGREVTGRKRVAVIEFVKRYLLEPDRRIDGVRWCSYGFLANSRFKSVIEAAKTLTVNRDGVGTRFLDLPIHEIRKRAATYRWKLEN